MFFAFGVVDMIKKCSKCKKRKEDTEFYLSAGKFRSECKKCTIKRNVRYQRKNESWKHRYADDEARKSYMRDYYSKNKEKFAEYRQKFNDKFPGYHRNYYLNSKGKRKVTTEERKSGSTKK